MKSENNDVVITGVGPVTSIGVGAEGLWKGLLSGRANVQRRNLPVDIATTVEMVVASMPPDAQVPDLDQHVEFLKRQDCAGYRDLAYALLAVELALADAKLQYDRDSNRVGMVQAFEAPGVEHTVSRLFGMMAGPMPTHGPPKADDHLAPFVYKMQAVFFVHVVGKAVGQHGFSTSVHNACCSGAFALEVAARQIRSGQTDAMIVVGGEAFETAVRLEWFRRLELYARDEQMRPFDSASSGFYVGEGAAAILLESAAHAAQRGAQPYAAYLGGAFAQQGWKQVIPDVRAARLREAIKEAMAGASLSARDLDLVVPHGASTLLSDGSESSCLAQALDGQAGQAVATVFKPYVGHMLACSGVIEMICGLLAMKHQTVPATLHSDPERVKLAIPLATEKVDRPVKTFLKLGIGFTGHDAASLFVKP